MLFHQMFEQASTKAPYADEAAGEAQVRDYGTMLRLFNALLTRAPEYNRSGVGGVPFNAILDRAMGTPAGFAAFLNNKVNDHLQVILNAWGVFLSSPDSRSVLNEDPRKGWFGADAMEDMPGFDEQFVCDPAAAHKGFESWDDFFTRRFRAGVRPVAAPEDDDVVANPCESAPYRIAREVAHRRRGRRTSAASIAAARLPAPAARIAVVRAASARSSASGSAAGRRTV